MCFLQNEASRWSNGRDAVQALPAQQRRSIAPVDVDGRRLVGGRRERRAGERAVAERERDELGAVWVLGHGDGVQRAVVAEAARDEAHQPRNRPHQARGRLEAEAVGALRLTRGVA